MTNWTLPSGVDIFLIFCRVRNIIPLKAPGCPLWLAKSGARSRCTPLKPITTGGLMSLFSGLKTAAMLDRLSNSLGLDNDPRIPYLDPFHGTRVIAQIDQMLTESVA